VPILTVLWVGLRPQIFETTTFFSLITQPLDVY
jgi:hypothetical protein